MKKGLLTGLLVLTFCALLTPAFAAEPDAADYLWYTQEGRAIYSEGDSEVVSGFEGQRFYLSADGGASYAELPGLKEQSERVWSDYVLSVTELPGGGLQLKGRNLWEGEYTWQKDYTADELSATLVTAQPTPVCVQASNGAVTLATRRIRGYCNDDPTQEGILGDNQDTYGKTQLLRTTDGVTWQTVPWPDGMDSVDAAWAEGDKLCLYDYVTYIGDSQFVYAGLLATTEDGLEWTVERFDPQKPPVPSAWSDGASLGPYRFELYGGEVYLMDSESWDTGVLLPHMGEGMRSLGMSPDKLAAWYGPQETVFLAAYDQYQKEEFSYALCYPISSLDWCLENLSTVFRGPEPEELNAIGVRVMTALPAEDGGEVSLFASYKYNSQLSQSVGQLLRNDGSGWKRVADVPFNAKFTLLPDNGKTFGVADQITGNLYFSGDGLHWKGTDVTCPTNWESGAYTGLEYSAVWTGEGYLVSRKGWEARHGMMGHSGGRWFEGNTKVYLLDEELGLTGTYDFGRLVTGVGYTDGVYSAWVANSPGSHERGFSEADAAGWFDSSLGDTLYISADGKNWEKTDTTRMPD